MVAEEKTPVSNEAAAPAEAPLKKKAKSSTGAKKSTAASKSKYNGYMKKELARLKIEEPDIPHKERFKRAAQSWGDAPENPKNKA